MDRRALFFLVAGGLAALLVPVTDSEIRWVPEWVTVIYVVLALASYFDWRAKRR